MEGQIVCSKSGRDKGYFMVVVREDGNFLYICEGKERPLERPKRKNKKHLQFTNTVLEKDRFKTNKSLRKALAIYKDCQSERRNRIV